MTPERRSLIKKPLQVVAAVMEKDDKVLIARRKEGGIGGDWEFPGGQVRAGETPEQALERELAEELGVRTRTGTLVCSVLYHNEMIFLDLIVYRSSLVTGNFTLTDHREMAWVSPSDLDESIFSEPDRPAVRMLKTAAKEPR